MEPASAKLCFFMISFITIVKPVSWVLSFIPPYGMRAAGDVKFSMITSCCTMWLCRVSLCIYLCRVWGFGPIAVWIGMFSDWTLRAIIFSIRFHSRKWLNHRVIENEANRQLIFYISLISAIGLIRDGHVDQMHLHCRTQIISTKTFP